MAGSQKYVRRQVTADDIELNEHAMQWFETLPFHVRPNDLAVRFPRIVNAIAAQWYDPWRCCAYLDSLLIDDRGGRQGFPFGIILEISDLRSYRESDGRRPLPPPSCR